MRSPEKFRFLNMERRARYDFIIGILILVERKEMFINGLSILSK